MLCESLSPPMLLQTDEKTYQDAIADCQAERGKADAEVALCEERDAMMQVGVAVPYLKVIAVMFCRSWKSQNYSARRSISGRRRRTKSARSPTR